MPHTHLSTTSSEVPSQSLNSRSLARTNISESTSPSGVSGSLTDTKASYEVQPSAASRRAWESEASKALRSRSRSPSRWSQASIAKELAAIERPRVREKEEGGQDRSDREWAIHALNYLDVWETHAKLMAEYIAAHKDVKKHEALAKVLRGEILAERKDVDRAVELRDEVLMKSIIPQFRGVNFAHIRGIFEQALSTQQKRDEAERQQKNYELDCIKAYLSPYFGSHE